MPRRWIIMLALLMVGIMVAAHGGPGSVADPPVL